MKDVSPTNIKTELDSTSSVLNIYPYRSHVFVFQMYKNQVLLVEKTIFRTNVPFECATRLIASKDRYYKRAYYTFVQIKGWICTNFIVLKNLCVYWCFFWTFQNVIYTRWESCLLALEQKESIRRCFNRKFGKLSPQYRTASESFCRDWP